MNVIKQYTVDVLVVFVALLSTHLHIIGDQHTCLLIQPISPAYRTSGRPGRPLWITTMLVVCFLLCVLLRTSFIYCQA